MKRFSRFIKEAHELEEAVTVKKKDYSWGKMMTVHHGSSHSFPLHPEHQEKIRKLESGQKTTFKDETGANITAHRDGDTIHLKHPSVNKMTAVARNHFTESVELEEQKMTFQDAEKLKSKHLAAMQHHKKNGNSKGYAAHSMVVDKFEDAYDRHGTGVIPVGRIMSASQKAFKDHPHSAMKESVELEEKLKASDDMGDWVKDFQDSDAPQFKGKSQKKRQQMAIAAKLAAERNEEVELDEKYKDPWAAPRKGSSAWHAAQQRKKAERDPEEVKRVNAIGNKNHMVGTAKVTHNESVEVSHDRYMRSHGKKASGGEGNWMFTHKRMGDANVNDPKEVHSARGKFSDAKKSAQQWAKKHGHSTVYVMEEVDLDEVSASTLRSYVDKARADKSRQQKARTVAKNDYKKYGIPSDKERADAAHSKASQRNTGISMAKRKLGGYTKGTQPKVLAREEVELDEVSDKKLDAYRQKAFADQPSGDDGSDKYRKRKFGRDLAFAKQTGRAKVLATKEEFDLTESHFNVGDRVRCVRSGMSGTVVKSDKPEVGKYYTVKQDSGKLMKYAPNELKAI